VDGSAPQELREKWESWAQGVLGGAPEQVEAATRAALGVLEAGAPQEQAVLAAQAAWAHATPAAGPVEPGRVRGRVAAFDQRSENREGTRWTIWSFEVQRGSDPPVEVEMRAIEFEGRIGNGDEVDLRERGRRRGKRPMRVRELANLTSNSTVRVARPSVAAARATVVGQILATGVAFAILGGIVAIVISQL
jgi:hypothetical protein